MPRFAGLLALTCLGFGPLRAALPIHLLDNCPLCVGGKATIDGVTTAEIGAVPAQPTARAVLPPGVKPSTQQLPPGTPPPANLAKRGPRPAFPRVDVDAAGRARIGFDHLASFAFTPPAVGAPATPGAGERIPANVRALHRQRVALQGFMLPTKIVGGLVTEMLVLRSSLLCCYGLVPEPNEWVVARMKGPGVPPQMDVSLLFTGVLKVGEIYVEGAFAGLYELECETVAGK